MKNLFFISTAFVGFLAFSISSIAQKNRNEFSVDIQSSRVESWIDQMTLEEKVSLLSGTGFATRPIPRLGIPAIEMTDGPMGVRFGHGTAFPADIAWASTFNRDLVYRAAATMGEEARIEGKQMLLAPCMNIARYPLGGRVFEGFGEDPYLAGEITAQFVKGVQSRGVMATTKHFALNNQENHRSDLDVLIDERALQEIYLPAFHKAVDAGTASIMASYNKVRGQYASENQYLLTKILKDSWGFSGFVVSDWGATHSTVEAANTGLDLEMPNGVYFGSDLLQAIQEKKVTISTIDEKVYRILSTADRFGIFDKSTKEPLENPAFSREVAREGIVLLKNQNMILPIKKKTKTKIALIGASGFSKRAGGGGSSMVHTDTGMSAVDALNEVTENLNAPIEYSYFKGDSLPGDLSTDGQEIFQHYENGNLVQGLKGSYFTNAELSGSPALQRVDQELSFSWEWSSPSYNPYISEDRFSIRWEGVLAAKRKGPHVLHFNNDDGIKVWLDDKLVLDQWHQVDFDYYNVVVNLDPAKPSKIVIEYVDRDSLATFILTCTEPSIHGELLDNALEAKKVAEFADMAILFVGLSNKLESEGYDRREYSLPAEQIKMVDAVLSAQPNTVLVVQAGSPVDLSRWADKVPAILYAWYPGDFGSLAIADILLGNVSPSGRLPMTFPKKWTDLPLSITRSTADMKQVEYEEGLFVGYRHFDRAQIEPLYAFGHGLSYSQFRYSDIKVLSQNANVATSPYVIEFSITNTGGMASAEVAQIYVQDLTRTQEDPVKELKQFTKVFLQPGETRQIQIELDAQAFAHYDVKSEKWVVRPGNYAVVVGQSSRAPRLSLVRNITQE